MKRNIILFLLIFSVISHVKAQESTTESAGETEQETAKEESEEVREVHLKDGTVLVGKVIEDNDYHIKIIIETGDTLTVGYKNILTGRRGRLRNEDKPPRVYSTNDYFFNLGLNSHFSQSTGSEINMSIGRRLNERFNYGISVGYFQRDNFLSNVFVEQKSLNVGAYSRYYFSGNKPKMFIDGTIGYGIDISTTPNFGFGQFEQNIDGGIQGSISAGVHFASRKRLSWLLKFGVSMSKLSGSLLGFDPFNGEIRTVFSKEFTTPFLGVGLEF